MRLNGIRRAASTIRPLRSRTVAASAMLALATLATPTLADEKPRPARSAEAPEVRITDNVVVLPIVMVREFPFIEGSIGRVDGKLMLDTGMESAMVLNDHRVPVSNSRPIGRGFFGSGQTYDVRLAPEVRDVRIAGLTFPRATDVRAQDARMLERITPDFIGWFGFNAFADHALKLDYRASRATFYRYGEADYLKGERVIATLSFDVRKLPNHPIMSGRIGSMPIAASWDTGQYGSLYTTDAGKARLLKEGRLKPSKAEQDVYDLYGLELDGRPMPPLKGIDVETSPSPAAAPTGVTEENELTIGYGFLRQFKTVWDYRKRRIYLLSR